MNVLVFDIETVPDVRAGRKLFELNELSDSEVADSLMHWCRQTRGSDFLPHHLHQIVAISAVLRSGEGLKVWSLGDESSSEAELIQRFFDGIEKYTPTLVSWNGTGFDLPVLHYRSLLQRVQAPQYWEVGDSNSNFRFNNYLNRFHYRHTDLMDILAGYQGRTNAPLEHIATMLGFPGKMGMSGAKVWEQYQQNNIKAIRDYCETDVLNTYLVFLRYEHMRGRLTDESLAAEEARLRAYLETDTAEHLQAFLHNWLENIDV